MQLFQAKSAFAHRKNIMNAALVVVTAFQTLLNSRYSWIVPEQGIIYEHTDSGLQMIEA